MGPAATAFIPANKMPEAEGAVPVPPSPKKADLKATAVLYISLALSGLFVLGLYDFLIEKESNKCGMSYMYELPQYVNISQTKHEKYTLYAYGEGNRLRLCIRENLLEFLSFLFR